MIVYGILGFLRPAVYILLFPFYTTFLSEADYGLFNLMLDVGAFAMIIMSFRISSAMLTYYYNYAHDIKLKKEYLSSSFSASIIVGTIMTIVLYLIGPSVFDLVFNSTNPQIETQEVVSFLPLGMIVVLYAAMTETGMIYLTYLKNEKDVIKYSLLIFIQLIAVVFFQVLLIGTFEMGVYGALLGMVIGWSIVLVSMIVMERGILTMKINWSMVVSSFKFSIALLPYLIIYWLLLQGGRVFLKQHSTLEVVGLFAAIMVLTRLIILGIESVINGIRPFLFDQFALGNEGDKNQIGLLTKMIIVVPLFTIPVIILVGTNIFLFTPNEFYRQIAPYMTMASMVIFAFIYVKLFYQQLIFAKRSDLATILSFVAVLFLIAGFLYWIPRYEIWGVLYATLLANIVLALLFYIAAQKVIFVKYDIMTIIFYPAVVFGVIFILEWWMIRSGYSYSTYGIVQCLVVSLLILIMNRNNFKDYKLLFMNRNKTKSA